MLIRHARERPAPRSDAHDPLAPLRDQFALDAIDAEGLIYLDGNSLGVLPKATRDRVRQVVDDEWGAGLIRSWNDAGWITLSRRIADKIARLIGARPGEVVVADSTSVNLYMQILSAGIAVVVTQSPLIQRTCDATAAIASSPSARTFRAISTSPTASPARTRTASSWCSSMPTRSPRTSTIASRFCC